MTTKRVKIAVFVDVVADDDFLKATAEAKEMLTHVISNRVGITRPLVAIESYNVRKDATP
jgi:hypothetical protein